MLSITIPTQEKEYYDESTSSFVQISIKEKTLQLEHSLISISKWESKWHKPFLDDKDKTSEETVDYIRCMTINGDVDANVYAGLTRKNIEDVKAYIKNPMTATWFRKESIHGDRNIVTSELIYYWMAKNGIPFECEKWHLNRLFTLLRIFGEKNKPPKKMSRKEAAIQQRKLNEQRIREAQRRRKK